MSIAIIIAMTEEMQPLRERLKPVLIEKIKHVVIERATFQDESLYLIESGIGKANAAQAATLAITRYHPKLLINYGVVGSLTPELQVGGVLLGNDFIYHDADETVFGSPYGRIPRMPVSYPVTREVQNFIQTYIRQATETPIIQGQVLTSDSFTADPKRLAWIKETFPAGIVVEMEATAIAQVAYTFDLPFLAIKTVSDDAGEEAANEYQQTKDTVALDSIRHVLNIIAAWQARTQYFQTIASSI